MEYKDITLKSLVANRPDLVDAIKSGEDENTSEVSVVKDSKGRTKVWTEITRDVEGNQVSKRVDTYSYYGTGEINTINQKVYGAGNLKPESEQDVRHYKDGTQPTVSKVMIKGVIK